MAVSIRLKRIGRKFKPIYRIVAMDSRKRPTGRAIEELGHYNPASKELTMDVERIKYWQSTGAIVSDTVAGLLKRKNQIPA